MLKPTKTLFTALAFLSALTLAGCGDNTSTSSNATTTSTTTSSAQKPANGQKTMIVGADEYSGAQKLASYEAKAKANPSNAQDQINAGIASYVNGNSQKAITYYKTAISDDPKNAIALNNLGNVYFRGLKDPKSALPYYQKTTEVDPTFVYGWWNLALCEYSLGQKDAAKQAVNDGLKKVAKSDPHYNDLAKVLDSLK